jgi:hypothetical protein
VKVNEEKHIQENKEIVRNDKVENNEWTSEKKKKNYGIINGDNEVRKSKLRTMTSNDIETSLLKMTSKQTVDPIQEGHDGDESDQWNKNVSDDDGVKDTCIVCLIC